MDSLAHSGSTPLDVEKNASSAPADTLAGSLAADPRGQPYRNHKQDIDQMIAECSGGTNGEKTWFDAQFGGFNPWTRKHAIIGLVAEFWMHHHDRKLGEAVHNCDVFCWTRSPRA